MNTFITKGLFGRDTTSILGGLFDKDIPGIGLFTENVRLKPMETADGNDWDKVEGWPIGN